VEQTTSDKAQPLKISNIKAPTPTLSLTSGLDHVLSWHDGKFCTTATLTPGSNIALINSSPGFSQFLSFVSLVGAPDEPVAFFGPHLIPDEDEDPIMPSLVTTATTPQFPANNEGATLTTTAEPPTNATIPHIIDFSPEEHGILPIIKDVEDIKSKLDNPMHELLLYHYRLAHEPFSNLQQMA
jgi:hypothetical protein